MLNKIITYTLLAAITLVPWPATAVNRFSLGHLLPKPEIKSVANFATNLVESLLIKSLLEISEGKNQQALDTINQLISSTPNFKLAHLVRGDLLMAQAKLLPAFGSSDINQTDKIKDLQEEARVRVERYLSQQSQERQPNLILAPNEKQNHLIVVDTDKSRLYLYKNQNNQLNYIADYYITIGKNGIIKQVEGDKRTPIGLYSASTKLNQPLPDMYGDGAYPLNYPNEWDKENKRTGSGIWIHGTPSNTYSRAPHASDGCIVVANEDLKSLAPILNQGNTPVIIANNLQWVDRKNSDNSKLNKDSLSVAIDQWLDDWKSQNTAKYLTHYSKDFASNGIDYQQWAEHKYRVQAHKPNVDIALSDLSMFSYPDSQKKLVVVDFVQKFDSPTLKNTMQKRQYWIQENNTWKIIYEGAS